MKKIVSVLFTLVLVMSLCVFGASAAGINAEEQKILDKLSSAVTYEGKTFTIPENYINQAKNYFIKEEITEAQAEEIMAEISKGEEIVKEQLKTAEAVNGVVEFKNLTKEAKEQILASGQSACKVVDLTLTYTDKTVTIVANQTNEVLFEDEPVVKTTGADVTLGYGAAFVTVLFAGFAAAAFALKKAK